MQLLLYPLPKIRLRLDSHLIIGNPKLILGMVGPYPNLDPILTCDNDGNILREGIE